MLCSQRKRATRNQRHQTIQVSRAAPPVDVCVAIRRCQSGIQTIRAPRLIPVPVRVGKRRRARHNLDSSLHEIHHAVKVRHGNQPVQISVAGKRSLHRQQHVSRSRATATLRPPSGKYPLEIAGDVYRWDLSFHHLKTGPCNPEYPVKRNFYLAAVKDLLKIPSKHPTLGPILFKSKKELCRVLSSPYGNADGHRSAPPPGEATGRGRGRTEATPPHHRKNRG